MTNTLKQYLGVAMIIAMLLVGLAAWRYAGTYANVGPGGFRSFSVSGEGRTVAIPDVARFTLSVITEGGRDVSTLQSDNSTKTNRVIDFLKGEGIEAKDIKTTGYSVEPRYQNYACPPSEFGITRPCPPSEIAGYTVRQSVEVTLRDFSKIGPVLSSVVDKGANSVSGVSFAVDDPTSVQAKAREEAVEKAKNKAKELAKAGGFRVGRLLSISEGGYYPYFAERSAYGMGGATDMKAPSPTIEPGSQEIVVTVNLNYEIR